MKKIVCISLAVVLAATLLCFVGCNGNALNDAIKNGNNYTIVCAYDNEAHALTAVQTVELTNRSENSFKAVKFHLFANQYREDAACGVVPNSYKGIAYPNGNSYGDITLDSVKVDGNAVAFSIEGTDMDILSVPLDTEWFPDQKVSVEMTYTVTLANILHRLGWTENVVNLGNFFPIVCNMENGNFACTPYYNIGDPFVSECANFDVTLKIAENFIVASSGNLVKATAENGFVTYNYSAEAVRDFAIVCSDKYQRISQTVGDTTINYFYYNDQDSETTLATAVNAFQYYSNNIGAFPYKQISVCETDFCYGGMEYPSLVMVTSGSKSYQDAVAHEVAHQWFYGVVGNNQIENAWMDEGLAEFLTYLYMDNAGVKTLSQNVLQNIKTYTTYVDVLNNYYENVNTAFRSVSEFKNDNEYVVMTYIKGSLLFNTLYETMGKDKFFRALKEYYKGAMFCVATPQQLSDSFAKVGGSELATIFANFAEGKEILGKVTD